ncbi:MAG TPA: hypothetical protein VFQ53_43005 [Kofleriaceae bacterium]|nr:hypothetical protein [Kofleriaceae bacterium]
MRKYLVALPLLVLACAAERPPAFERDRVLLGPIPLKRQLAWIDSALDRVVAIDAGDDARPAVHAWKIGRRPVFAAPTPAGDHVLVVTRGEEALARGQIDEEPTFWNVDITAPGSKPLAYEVSSPFDRIAVSQDGAIAVAYFSEAGPDAEGFFRNPSELAFIDLTQPPGPTNPVMKTIRSFGAAPSGIVLSPRMAIPGAADPSERVFAFVLARNVLTVIDASHPDRDEVSIRLDGAGQNVLPRELVFAPNTATAYMRSDGARDVLEIVLVDDPPSPDGTHANDYHPLLAELGAGGAPSDIAVFDNAAGIRYVLAATPATREVVIIDADTAQFRKVATPDPIDRIVVFPGGDEPATTAVLAQIGAPMPRVHSLPLVDVQDPLAVLDVDTIEVGEPVRDLSPVPGRDLAMMVHDDNRTVLGMLDVGIGSVSPLQGIGRLDTYAFTPAGDFLVGTTDDVPRLGLLDLSNLHPTDLRLDYTPRQVYALANGALIVDHGDPFGRATIIPSPASERRDSTVLSGFLLANFLDQEAP